MNPYRRKPVAVLAKQWFRMGDHPAVIDLRSPVVTNGYGILYETGLRLVNPGDWIITEADGFVTNMSPEDFAKHYEPG